MTVYILAMLGAVPWAKGWLMKAGIIKVQLAAIKMDRKVISVGGRKEVCGNCRAAVG